MSSDSKHAETPSTPHSNEHPIAQECIQPERKVVTRPFSVLAALQEVYANFSLFRKIPRSRGAAGHRLELTKTGQAVVMGGAGLAALSFITGKGWKRVSQIITVVYPLLCTFKALNRAERASRKAARRSFQIHRWLSYWAVYGSVRMVESTMGMLLKFLPFYDVFRLLFCVWCYSSKDYGAVSFYRTILNPMYMRYRLAVARRFKVVSTFVQSSTQNAVRRALMGRMVNSEKLLRFADGMTTPDVAIAHQQHDATTTITPSPQPTPADTNMVANSTGGVRYRQAEVANTHRTEQKHQPAGEHPRRAVSPSGASRFSRLRRLSIGVLSSVHAWAERDAPTMSDGESSCTDSSDWQAQEQQPGENSLVGTKRGPDGSRGPRNSVLIRRPHRVPPQRTQQQHSGKTDAGDENDAGASSRSNQQRSTQHNSAQGQKREASPVKYSRTFGKDLRATLLMDASTRDAVLSQQLSDAQVFSPEDDQLTVMTVTGLASPDNAGNPVNQSVRTAGGEGGHCTIRDLFSP